MASKRDRGGGPGCGPYAGNDVKFSRLEFPVDESGNPPGNEFGAQISNIEDASDNVYDRPASRRMPSGARFGGGSMTRSLRQKSVKSYEPL
jgi:hypothetical protein